MDIFYEFKIWMRCRKNYTSRDIYVGPWPSEGVTHKRCPRNLEPADKKRPPSNPALQVINRTPPVNQYLEHSRREIFQQSRNQRPHFPKYINSIDTKEKLETSSFSPKQGSLETRGWCKNPGTRPGPPLADAGQA